MTNEQRQATIDAIKDLINSKSGESSEQGNGGDKSDLNLPGVPGKPGLSGSSSSGGKSSIQIGDRGSAEIQAAEEAERKATIEKEKAEDAANHNQDKSINLGWVSTVEDKNNTTS